MNEVSKTDLKYLILSLNYNPKCRVFLQLTLEQLQYCEDFVGGESVAYSCVDCVCWSGGIFIKKSALCVTVNLEESLIMESSMSTVVPSSPWKAVQQPCKTKFTDIMSEQLANLDGDCKQESNDSPQVESPNCSPFVPGCESDKTIAQILQLQFDKEHYDLVKWTEDKLKGNAKVSVSYANYRIMPENLLYDSEEEIYEKNREWDSFMKSDNVLKNMPKCGHKKHGAQLITKHDIEMTSRRNASRVMDFPPEFHTGDGGGFDMQLSNKVFNSLKVHSRNEQSRRQRVTDKCDKATAVLGVDAKTRLLLYKLLNQEILERVNGTLNTGKEAVVVHADGGMINDIVVPKECAIKIFKTTLNEFKSRDKYIQDDFRFKDRFSKQNPRKIIHLWAEKEMHNLIRMHKFGILCPKVVILKKHVLVMSFVGSDHKPAQKLKETNLEPVELRSAYEDCVSTMKKLYSDARLVHADLSEYNILWHEGRCWFIDVSQAVEQNHPRALEFLYRDCSNVSNFFRRRGLTDALSPENLFKEICGTEVEVSDKIKDFEKDLELLTFDKPVKDYPFEYCWEQSKSEGK